MEIITEKFILRPFRPEDAESIAHHANNKNVWRNLRDAFPYPYSTDNAREWIDGIIGEGLGTEAVIEINGQAAGAIGVHPGSDVNRLQAEFGYWLGEEFWGRGIMSAAATEFVKYVFQNFSFERLQSFVFEWNMASARVLEKTGFTLDARLRKSVYKDCQLIDCFLYSRLR